MKQPETFSTQLEQWLKSSRQKTLGDLISVFGEKSFGVMLLILMILPALPIPTGGITHVFEIVAMLIGLEMVLGLRTIWIPRWALIKNVSGIAESKVMHALTKKLRWIEKYSRPRMGRLLDNTQFLRLVGLLVIGFSLTAFLSPPFSGLDTIPSMAVVLLSLAIILGDVVLAAVGTIVGLIGVGLVVFLGKVIVDAINRFI